MRIRWTRPFAQNLEAAREYIATDNPAAAAGIIKQIIALIDRLRRFPEVGRVSSHKPDIRQIPVPGTPFILVYRVKNDTLELLALWHHAQKWPKA